MHPKQVLPLHPVPMSQTASCCRLVFPVSHCSPPSGGAEDKPRRRPASARLAAHTVDTDVPRGLQAWAWLPDRLALMDPAGVRAWYSSLRRLRRAVMPLLAVAAEHHPQHRPDWMSGGDSRGFKDHRVGQRINLVGVSR
jgi:hypothetical protein